MRLCMDLRRISVSFTATAICVLCHMSCVHKHGMRPTVMSDPFDTLCKALASHTLSIEHVADHKR